MDFYSDTINNRLYAVGDFSFAGSGTITCPSNVAYWDGNQWHAVGNNSLQMRPREVYVHKNEVYVGFSTMRFNLSGDTLSGIAKWDGSDWMPLDRGVWNNSVYSTVYGMVTFNDELAVGGGFTTAGSVSANLIASWGDTITSLPQQLISEKLFEIFPNPTKDKLEIKFTTQVNGNFQIIVSDATGKTVLQKEYSNNSLSIVINLSEDLMNGVYTCRIVSDERQYSENFVLER